MRKIPWWGHIILFFITAGMWLFIYIGYFFGKKSNLNNNSTFNDSSDASSKFNKKIKALENELKQQMNSSDNLNKKIKTLENE